MKIVCEFDTFEEMEKWARDILGKVNLKFKNVDELESYIKKADEGARLMAEEKKADEGARLMAEEKKAATDVEVLSPTELKKTFAAKIKDGKKPQVREILDSFGVERLTDFLDQYGDDPAKMADISQKVVAL